MKRYQVCSIILLLSTLTCACGRVGDSANASAFPQNPVQLQRLVLATGLVVDDAILVVEASHYDQCV